MKSQRPFSAFFLVILGLNIISPTSSEVFSSASDLRQVFMLERELVDILQSYATKLESRLGLINNYLEARSNYLRSRVESFLTTNPFSRRGSFPRLATMMTDKGKANYYIPEALNRS